MNIKLFNIIKDLPKITAVDIASNLIAGINDCEKDEETGVMILKYLAEEGYSEAQYLLYVYLDDNRDVETAIYWLMKAVEQDHPRAQAMLFCEHRDGNIGWIDERTALEYLMKSVDSGFSTAMAILGDQYHYGSSILEKDKAVAKQYYKKAACMGNSFAMFNMYHILKNEDRDLALIWLRKSAECGYTEAKFELWVELSCEAFSWLQSAKEDNYIHAIYDYARIQETDIFVKKDIDSSNKIYKSLVRENHTGAAKRVVYNAFDKEYKETVNELFDKSYFEALAIIVKNQIYEGISTNENIKYLKKAVSLGSKDAMYELGLILLLGGEIEGCSKYKDITKAYEYISKAAKVNYAPAEVFIANEYMNGNNVSNSSDDEVVEYLFDAANQNYSKAFNLLGVMYYEGVLVDKDIEKAKGFFHEAIDNDDFIAYYNLGKLNEILGNKEDAIEYYFYGADNAEYNCLVELKNNLHYLSEVYPEDKIIWLKQKVKEIQDFSDRGNSRIINFS